MRKKLFIILLCCSLALLLATGSAVWWASRYMKTQQFRDELGQMVQDATGREATLAGEISISLFPWFGITAQGLTLGNDLSFSSTPLLTAHQVSARIKVLPLLRRRLVFDIVELEDATVVLTLDMLGRGNWDGLVERLRAQENATEKTGSFFRKSTVRGIRVVRGSARLDDLKHNHSYIATNIDLRTGRIESGKGLPFTVVCDFNWPRPGLEAHVEGTGSLHWSKVDQEPLFTDTRVQGEIGGTFLPKNTPRAAVSAMLSMEEANKHLKLSDLKLRVLGAEITGELTFFDVTEMFRLDARLRAGRFSPQTVINAYWPGAIAHDHQGALRQAQGPLNLFANVDELVFESPGFELDSSQIKGRLRMGFAEVSGLDFDLAANHLDVDASIAALASNATGAPLEVADLPLSYLRQVKGAGRITADSLKLAGVTGQGAAVLWQGAAGQHRMQLNPTMAQGGNITADLSASFAEAALASSPAAGKSGAAGMPGAPDKAGAALAADAGKSAAMLLGWSGSLRLNGVDARQVSWLNRPGFSTAGRMDLIAKAEAPKAPAQAKARLSQVVRRATATVSATLGASTLEWAAEKKQPKGQARSMNFSSLQASARFLPAALGDADWALQMEGGGTAVGTKPVLSLDAKFGGLLRSQQGQVTLTGATASGKLKGWFLPKRENEASFSGKGNLDVSAQNLNLSSSFLQACGLNVSGALAGKQIFGENFSVTGRIRCQEGDPKRLLSALEMTVPKSSDKRALQNLSGEADLALGKNSVALTNIAAQLDDMPLRGSYGVQNFEAPRQTLSLSGGNFDLDRYLPAPEPSRRGVHRERPAPEPLPMDSLRDLNLDGTVALRSFKYRGLTTRDFKASLSAHAGLLSVKPLGGNFYGGTLTGEFQAQAVGGGMQTRLALVAKGFQAGPFMLGWTGKELVTGKTDMFLDLGGVGTTDTELLRSLEGMAAFKITDGSYVLTGSPEAQRAPKNPPGATAPQPAATRHPGAPFTQASAKLKVQKGVFQTEDFRLDGANMLVTGKGQFSPVDDTINLRLSASMSNMPDVPIKVFGRLKDPEMEIPTGTLIGNTIMSILGLPLKPIKFFKDLLF